MIQVTVNGRLPGATGKSLHVLNRMWKACEQTEESSYHNDS